MHCRSKILPAIQHPGLVRWREQGLNYFDELIRRGKVIWRDLPIKGVIGSTEQVGSTTTARLRLVLFQHGESDALTAQLNAAVSKADTVDAK